MTISSRAFSPAWKYLDKISPIRKKLNISFFGSYRLTPRFFYLLGGLVVIASLGFALPWLIPLTDALILVVLAVVIAETIILYSGAVKPEARRSTTKMLSLGDDNKVELWIENTGNFAVQTELYDEMPYQLQIRNFGIRLRISPDESSDLSYHVRPVVRGEYHFGHLNAITTVATGLVARRFLLAHPAMVPVYPSVIQMKKYELLAFARISTFEGVKKVRRLGHSYEFDQIKTYTFGDDIRSINWKATGRRSQIMVNQYEDERAQPVYSIIDKSRSMHMPFNGLSLLDYAVNTSLVISNIALRKHDKAGLITFSNIIGSSLKAENSELQLKKILQALYFEKPRQQESDYQLLYRATRNIIKSRSLIFLYLNFESMYAVDRALPVLQKINRDHLLVVMIFENTELTEYTRQQVEYVSDVYAQTIAQRLIYDKKSIVARLRKYGIQVILSRPEELSINTVNKYLELKARSLI